MSKIHFASFEDYFNNFHPHIGIYGWNGSGKTSFAAKNDLRTLEIDCGDAGVVTLRKIKSKKLRIVRIKSITQYLDVIESAVRIADQIDLLVVDTVSGLQSLAIKEVKGKRKFEMNQKKWGAVGSRVIECIQETSEFPKDVIYLMQEKRKSKPNDEIGDIISPSITPGVREFLSSKIDWMGRLYVEDGQRKLNFVYSEDCEAKDRADLFPKVIGNVPDHGAYLKIRERIVSSIK